MKRLNNFEIRPGRHLVVTKSVDNRRLWVNGIPKNRSSPEIRAEMERLTGGVRDIILYPSQADKSKSRGYMFVEYESHRAAAMARKKLIKGNYHIYGQEIGTVDWAEPETDVDEETMSTVRILFVRNLMLSTTETTLRDLFNRLSGEHDTVERVKKTKDYAFVHFSNRDSAERALTECRDLKIDNAEVEVVWSKPVDKQSYNTRKALTKVFTTGVPSVQDTQGNFGPRRRGAAGIRGLGAPGTAPPKQLVQRYTSMGTPGPLPGLTPFTGLTGLTGLAPVPLARGQLSYKSPVDHLHDVALASGWGEPVYTALPEPEVGGQSPGSETGPKYCYKVIIVVMLSNKVTLFDIPGDSAQPPTARPTQHIPASAVEIILRGSQVRRGGDGSLSSADVPGLLGHRRHCPLRTRPRARPRSLAPPGSGRRAAPLQPRPRPRPPPGCPSLHPGAGLHSLPGLLSLLPAALR